MITWVYRAVVLAACPAIVYFQITHTKQGFAVGLGVGIVLVALEAMIESIQLFNLVAGAIGCAGGIIAMKLLDYSVFQVNNDSLNQVWDRYSALRYFSLAALGTIVAFRKLPELDSLDKDLLERGKRRGSEMKVVDTSAIIDGRVVDIAETNFLSGALIVPRFILNELHQLADSEDALKRARGRRGLDILARLKEIPSVPLKIVEKDIPEIKEVDGKLVRFAKELGAKVLTTDFNLNKIAALEGVPCLNVNDLSNALKPVVLPGETMSLFVMKEGKERDQGVGYLDDGTMVVIEDGRRFIGKRVDASVTSILQTPAGRMIFGKARGESAGRVRGIEPA
ncbi:MAG: TRAM domain-containing protein [Elusimicrobia bacterium]|nr:TRAM domain-containing protein [Elusimicrobiota bacterium]